MSIPKGALLASIALLSLGADQFRRAPLFEGKSIPDPPGQGRPWTPPPTKLPRFLVDATAALFEHGVADPRGCEYREVQVGEGGIVKARGFVLPERADSPGRFVVGWNGLVYPALTVGEPADLDREVRGLADALRKIREAGASDRHGYGTSWAFPREGPAEFRGWGIDDHSPIKLCLLLRLGRSDLAEALFAAGTTWTPEPRARDLTDYHISYLTLATDRAASGFSRLIGAHIRGDDVIALDAARRLARFRDLATARADAMGFPRAERQARQAAGPAPRFDFLDQLDELLGDQERRAKLPPRGPIPKRGGDPTARIAALIRDLDQIDEQQMMSPGMAHPGGSPLVKDLIAEGDAAVPPLLEVLESDNRLTRSVTNGRGDSISTYVHPVHEAAFDGLIGILKTGEFQNRRLYGSKAADPAARKALARSIREFWEKNRAISLAERWYRTLLDDSAGPEGWVGAAGAIVTPDVGENSPARRPVVGPLKGDALRVGKGPSVTDLMLRRFGQIHRSGEPETVPGPTFASACRMAAYLSAWDERAALPLLRLLMKESRERSDRWRARESRPNADPNLAQSLTGFTRTRVRLGEPEALDEYADWLRTTGPEMLENGTIEAFQLLLDHRDRPSLDAAARWLFGDPKSPWVPLVPNATSTRRNPFLNLLASPLVAVAGFREGLLASLADKAPIGTVVRDSRGGLQYKFKDGQTMGTSSFDPDVASLQPGAEIAFRACDLAASKVSALEGSPRCEPYWPEARREEAVAACSAYLKRYGERFTTEAPPGMHDFPGPRAHLRFPILGRPATLEDVAGARAIFSLEGSGETRPVRLPGLPQKARWTTLKDTPIQRTDQDGVTRVEYDTEGFVWQAEEVRKGDAWERYFGFVGHHVIARAPASEVEFSGENYSWWNLKGGLDARTSPVEPFETAYRPGRPIVVALHLRNRLGVEHSSPTEFLRPAVDGKPAIRRGVTLALFHSPPARPGSNRFQGQPTDKVQAKRSSHFDPGDGSRLLAPLEAFEAMRLDVNDWFDATRPGWYRLRITFGADSGAGEGSASEALFRVGEDE